MFVSGSAAQSVTAVFHLIGVMMCSNVAYLVLVQGGPCFVVIPLHVHHSVAGFSNLPLCAVAAYSLGRAINLALMSAISSVALFNSAWDPIGN